MENGDEKDLIGEGTVVRDRKWGGTCTGTVVRREGDSVFVAWHNSFVSAVTWASCANARPRRKRAFTRLS